MSVSKPNENYMNLNSPTKIDLSPMKVGTPLTSSTPSPRSRKGGTDPTQLLQKISTQQEEEQKQIPTLSNHKISIKPEVKLKPSIAQNLLRSSKEKKTKESSSHSPLSASQRTAIDEFEKYPQMVKLNASLKQLVDRFTSAKDLQKKYTVDRKVKAKLHEDFEAEIDTLYKQFKETFLETTHNFRAIYGLNPSSNYEESWNGYLDYLGNALAKMDDHSQKIAFLIEKFQSLRSMVLVGNDFFNTNPIIEGLLSDEETKVDTKKHDNLSPTIKAWCTNLAIKISKNDTEKKNAELFLLECLNGVKPENQDSVMQSLDSATVKQQTDPFSMASNEDINGKLSESRKKQIFEIIDKEIDLRTQNQTAIKLKYFREISAVKNELKKSFLNNPSNFSLKSINAAFKQSEFGSEITRKETISNLYKQFEGIKKESEKIEEMINFTDLEKRYLKGELSVNDLKDILEKKYSSRQKETVKAFLQTYNKYREEKDNFLLGQGKFEVDDQRILRLGNLLSIPQIRVLVNNWKITSTKLKTQKDENKTILDSFNSVSANIEMDLSIDSKVEKLKVYINKTFKEFLPGAFSETIEEIERKLKSLKKKLESSENKQDPNFDPKATQKEIDDLQTKKSFLTHWELVNQNSGDSQKIEASVTSLLKSLDFMIKDRLVMLERSALTNLDEARDTAKTELKKMRAVEAKNLFSTKALESEYTKIVDLRVKVRKGA